MSNAKSIHTPSPSNPKITYTKVKNGYFYHIPFDQIEHIEYCPMNGSRGETVTNAAKRIQWNGRYPDIITNAELFNGSYKAASGVVNDSKNDKLTDTYGIGFKDKKTPVFSYKNGTKADDWLGAYPCLVRNGLVDFAAVPSGLGGNRARTAIGIKDNNTLGVLVIPEQSNNKDANLRDVANAFINEGYTYAINLDGGGSTAYQTNEFSYEQGRRVRGFVCVWYKNGNENLVGRKVSAVAKEKEEVKMNASTSTIDGLYKVKITASKLNVRRGASIFYRIKTIVSKNEIYTVTEVKGGWGRLAEVDGWINLKYSKKV